MEEFDDDDVPLELECEHGHGVAAVICTHLAGETESTVGFVENSDEPGNLQAWCECCEDFFREHGEEMTKEFVEFNDFHLVCEQCYDAIKRKHER